MTELVTIEVVTAPLAWSWSAPWLGREWVLTDLDSPVLKLRGATGAGQAPVEHWWSDAPTLDGSAWDGARTGRGQVFLPLMVHAPDSATFVAAHAEFMRSLDPTQEGTLRVSRPDGSWREIGCRYESGADFAIELDPVASCRAIYGITWATGDPFWRGAAEALRYPYESGVTPRLPGPGWSPAAGQSLATAVVVNPGDVESYPVWRVDGPFTGFTLGVGGSLMEMTLTRTAGQWVEVDMTPRRLTILDEAGTDRWDNVTDVAFAPIPPGESTLTTTLLGAGAGSAVTLTFTPRYRTAF